MYTMTESVAVAKEADAKKGVSPTRSDNSILRVQNEPERQIGSLRDVIANIRRNGGTPSVERIATELSSVHTAQRAPALLALQQTHGNRYVQRVVSRIQAKLKIGQPGDIYEQEADRVADEVIRMPEPRVQRQFELEGEEEETLQTKPLANEITPLVQLRRQEKPEEEEETLQAKSGYEPFTPLVQRQPVEEEEELQRQQMEEEDEEPVQAKTGPRHSPERASTLETQINSIRNQGQPLPKSVRSFFEPRFGRDFSSVRLHTSRHAADAAQAVNAKAFTIGRDIVFGSGQYSPYTQAGKGLLAHELAHVVQQQGGLQPSAPASSPAAEEIWRTPQTRKPVFNNTQGILADLKKNLVIQRRILIGTGENQHKINSQEIVDLVYRPFAGTEGTPIARPPTLTPPALRSSYIIDRNRRLAQLIVDDMRESSEDLYFRDLDELRREIATRIETSTAMQATQEGPERRAFAYPRRGLDNYYGPRVNIAARDYWEPSVPDNYRVRRPAQAMNPLDPDLAQGGAYHFTLTTPGRLNGYQALMSLFEPQSHVRHRTLIHCDRLANLIHFRSFAVTLGPREFNRRVEGGFIPLVLRYNGYFGIRYSDVVREVGPATRVHLRVVYPVNRGDLLIGDHVVFHNHRHYDSLMEIAGMTGVWRLEHAILIDRQGSDPEPDPERDDIFLGHGSGRRNEQGIKRVLRTHFNNMVGHARGMLLRDYNRLESRFSGRLTRSGREFYIGGWQIHEITENDVPGLYDPRTYPGGSLFQVHRPAESRRD
jgi:hypothetical protein